ncbi:uncharacterized protein N7483_002891 [Penicillium malachiteum]|uniref:uncharacterized protein n=1 Tax=Penicillium malachiteum TaxID=1324776 RepID=UPI002546B529|nr:uncharacterized protein N7483_002891 [Penicillium malachiteum]KAJ5737766.1 hypothetical protein N7483_002891 [Penicillium malachiteum]
MKIGQQEHSFTFGSSSHIFSWKDMERTLHFPGDYLRKSTLRTLARNISGYDLPPSRIDSNTFPDEDYAAETANSAWQEVGAEIKGTQKPLDRADIISRVFQQKKQQLFRKVQEKEISRRALVGSQPLSARSVP